MGNTGPVSKTGILTAVGAHTPVGPPSPRSELSKIPPEQTLGMDIQRRAGYGRVSVESLELFLKQYRKCGSKAAAAAAANLSYSAVRAAERRDPAFKAEVQQAHSLYVAEVLESAALEQGVEGIKEPIVGGVNRDQIVGYKRVVQPRILELLLKRHDPAYREKQEVDVNHSGGVLVVGAPARSADEWADKFRKVESQNREIVDHPDESAPSDGSDCRLAGDGDDPQTRSDR